MFIHITNNHVKTQQHLTQNSWQLCHHSSYCIGFSKQWPPWQCLSCLASCNFDIHRFVFTLKTCYLHKCKQLREPQPRGNGWSRHTQYTQYIQTHTHTHTKFTPPVGAEFKKQRTVWTNMIYVITEIHGTVPKQFTPMDFYWWVKPLL